MCGIVGFINQSPDKSGDDLAGITSGMIGTLLHRGPDDEGVWVDPAMGVAIGHRRLSVLDISALGRQPMLSASGRYAIVYNGEIYNFKLLRRELEEKGRKFTSTSDTEVLLAAVEEWGLTATVHALVGMFAFALWDREEKSLHLVRDRLGEKPLYYGWQSKSFVFGSELKALKVHPAWQGEINREALALYMRHNAVPGPYSIYRNIYKLPPGCMLAIKTPQQKPDAFSPFAAASFKPSRLTPLSYWSLQAVAEAGRRNPFPGSEDEALAGLEVLLKRAVSQQMISDVPLGAFLSGGIDSSMIVALMQSQSDRQIKTFTIGLHEGGYDEAGDARKVATHMGTAHTELYVSPEEARAVIPRLPYLYDEPFADSSHIPTFLVSKLARQHVTVSLSGDGGDELFGGYNRHALGPFVWQRFGWLPAWIRKTAAKGMTALSPLTWDAIFRSFDTILPRKKRYSMPGDRLYKLAEALAAGSPEEMYLQFISHWQPDSLVIGTDPKRKEFVDSGGWGASDFAEQMMCQDALMYLPDDILVKVDRAAMGVSLETRMPFLDHRVVEFAWRLPVSMKIHNGQGKRILRKLLYKYVPRELVEKPKMGFAVPIDAWLRGPLRDWAEDLLDGNRLRREGFFKPEPVRSKWQEHLAGRRNWQYHLWDVLMFQAWYQTWEKH